MLDPVGCGQAEAIARSIEACLEAPVPVIATIIGEGGSGGAIALGAGDRVLMLEHAIYTVISPEGLRLHPVARGRGGGDGRRGAAADRRRPEAAAADRRGDPGTVGRGAARPRGHDRRGRRCAVGGADTVARGGRRGAARAPAGEIPGNGARRDRVRISNILPLPLREGAGGRGSAARRSFRLLDPSPRPPPSRGGGEDLLSALPPRPARRYARDERHPHRRTPAVLRPARPAQPRPAVGAAAFAGDPRAHHAGRAGAVGLRQRRPPLPDAGRPPDHREGGRAPRADPGEPRPAWPHLGHPRAVRRPAAHPARGGRAGPPSRPVGAALRHRGQRRLHRGGRRAGADGAG